MVQFTALEKFGIAFLVAIILYILNYVLQLVYTYVVGPAVNKVDFKSKGQWARK